MRNSSTTHGRPATILIEAPHTADVGNYRPYQEMGKVGSYLRCYCWSVGAPQSRDWNATYGRRKELPPIIRNESRAKCPGLLDHWSSCVSRNDGIQLQNKHTEAEAWNITYCRKFSAHWSNKKVQSTHSLFYLFIHLFTHVTLDTSISFQTFAVYWMLYAFFWVIPGVWNLYADVSEHSVPYS